MRIYPGSLQFLKWTLPALVKITDLQLLVLDRVLTSDLPFIPQRFVTAQWEGQWDHYRQLDFLFRQADELSPEWVVYPDSDEILPTPMFPNVLQECKRRGLQGVNFPYAELFGGFDYQIAPWTVTTSRHLKVVLWRRGLTFFDSPGFCVPKGLWGKSLECPHPLLHLRYLTEEARSERRKHTHGTDDFAKRPLLIECPPSWAEDYDLQSSGTV